MNLKKISAIIFVFFIFLSVSEYKINRQRLLGVSESKPVTFSSITANAHPDSSVTFSWNVDSTTPRKITDTTVFYGSISTDSAHISHPNISPYDHSVPDFRQIELESNTTFSVTINSPEKSPIFYRVYARVDNGDFLSQEFRLDL